MLAAPPLALPSRRLVALRVLRLRRRRQRPTLPPDRAVLHRLPVRAGAENRERLHLRPRHQHHHRRRRRPRVHRHGGAVHRLLHPHRVPHRQRRDARRRPLRHVGRHDGDALLRGVRPRDGHLRPDRRQRGRHRRDERPAGDGAGHYRSPRRGRERDQGRHQGVLHRLGRPRVLPALLRLHGRGARAVRPSFLDSGLRGARGVRRWSVRRHARLRLLRPGHPGGGEVRTRCRRGGAPAVRRAAWHHGRLAEAGLQQVRCDRDQGLALRDAEARRAGAAAAHRHWLRLPRGWRAAREAFARPPSARGLPDGRHHLRHPALPVPEQRGRRVG
mmetsp:Transcript_17343/g.39737  ORF Transcript_17343/g.39737 Transcript_17343/m.39737 type:complete len:330 (-) Transcript_17343:17-1006(-)